MEQDLNPNHLKIPVFVVEKRVNGEWERWWFGDSRYSAVTEFRLCLKYGKGARMRLTTLGRL